MPVDACESEPIFGSSRDQKYPNWAGPRGAPLGSQVLWSEAGEGPEGRAAPGLASGCRVGRRPHPAVLCSRSECSAVAENTGSEPTQYFLTVGRPLSAAVSLVVKWVNDSPYFLWSQGGASRLK